MNNRILILIAMVVLLIISVSAANAQHIELGVSPAALATRFSVDGSESYNNSAHLLIEVGTSDTSRLLYQARYDVFDGNDQPIDSDDNSFQNLGLGARYRFCDFHRFSLSAFASVGCMLTDPHNIRRASVWYKEDTTKKEPYRSRMPSLVNLSVGITVAWSATQDFEPYIEASLLNSLKLQSDEKTGVELFAARIGARIKI
ncbi:MAG: hypothetical protein U0264_03535 [Candidatus Kapaibacterium sp.]